MERKEREKRREGKQTERGPGEEPREDTAKMADLYRNQKLGKEREAQTLGWSGLG